MVKTVVRQYGLTLAFGLLFALALAGQFFTGHAEFNNQQVQEGLASVSLAQYLFSSAFAVDIAENWQSEYLQFLLYIWATVWLAQRGSSESKKPDDVGLESDEQQLVAEHSKADSPPWSRRRGWRLQIYSSSLALAMGTIFVLSWLAQAVAGRISFNAERLSALQDPVSLGSYLTSAEFWNRTLQNWQSEFLAVASMVVLSMFLRQRGSPESKPVGSPHAATGVEG